MTDINSQVAGSPTDEVAIQRVVERAAELGVEVFAFASDIDTGRSLGVNSKTPVVTASVFKVPVLLEYARQSDSGVITPESSVTLQPENRTLGPTGISVLSDPTTWSLRDLASSMISVSDNAATDALMKVVGLERVNQTMRELGLTETVIVGDCSDLFASLARDFSVDVLQVAAAMNAHPERVATADALTAELTNRTTPEEAVRLLTLIWRDEAGSSACCAEVRRILALQVWQHRITSGFPEDGVTICGKTGTLGVVRNEIAVVEYPDGGRYAVAVFLRTPHYPGRAPRVDAFIGVIAREFVDALRAER